MLDAMLSEHIYKSFERRLHWYSAKLLFENIWTKYHTLVPCKILISIALPFAHFESFHRRHCLACAIRCCYHPCAFFSLAKHDVMFRRRQLNCAHYSKTSFGRQNTTLHQYSENQSKPYPFHSFSLSIIVVAFVRRV